MGALPGTSMVRGLRESVRGPNANWDVREADMATAVSMWWMTTGLSERMVGSRSFLH